MIPLPMELPMTITPDDVVQCTLSEHEIYEAATYAYHVLTHAPSRTDVLGTHVRVLIEELAERLVMQWLREQGKFVVAGVDKGASQPDLKHEIWVTDIRGVKVRAAVHTFLSTHKSEMPDILESHSLSVDTAQMCGINFSVVYWYQLREKPRIMLPSLQQTALLGWVSDKNLREKMQSGQTSKYAAIKFNELRPLAELLQFLV
jgi:hypothetical protein